MEPFRGHLSPKIDKVSEELRVTKGGEREIEERERGRERESDKRLTLRTKSVLRRGR